MLLDLLVYKKLMSGVQKSFGVSEISENEVLSLFDGSVNSRKNTSRRCPICGKVIEDPNMFFCTQCGSSLQNDNERPEALESQSEPNAQNEKLQDTVKLPFPGAALVSPKYTLPRKGKEPEQSASARYVACPSPHRSETFGKEAPSPHNVK